MKKNISVLLVLLCSLFFIEEVKADSYGPDFKNGLGDSMYVHTSHYKKDHQFRLKVEGMGIQYGSPYKGVNNPRNLNAYCVSMKHKVDFYSQETRQSWCANNGIKISGPSERIAGYIIEYINEEKSNTFSPKLSWLKIYHDKKDITSDSKCNAATPKYCDSTKKLDYFVHAMKSLALNSYMKQISAFDGAVDFSVQSSDKWGAEKGNTALPNLIKSIIKAAKEKYEKDVKSWEVSMPKISKPSNRVMKKLGSNSYITSATMKVTQDSKLPNDSAITTTITGTIPGGTVSFCTKSNGKGCVSNPAVGTAYYVMVVPNSGQSVEGTEVNVKAVSTISFKYPRMKIYCAKDAKNEQIFGVHGLYTRDDKEENSFKLSIPTPNPENKSIKIQKVDGKGELLAGGNFELIDNNNNKYTLTKSADGKTFTYSTSSSAFDFSNLTFTLKEITTPNGYVTHEDISNISLAGGNSTKYYKVSDNPDVDDEEITKERYDTKTICEIVTKVNGVITNTEYKDMVDDNCNSYVPTTEQTSTGDTGTSTGGDTGTSTGGDTGTSTGGDTGTSTGGDQGDNTPVPDITVNQICAYKKDDGTYNTNYSESDCDNTKKYAVTISGNYVYIEFPNELNTVSISKTDATGEKEVFGAKLKICTEATYKSKGNDCEAAKTVNDVTLSWESTGSPSQFSGIPVGNYYIIETVPPLGYKTATTATQFSIDKDNVVKVGKTTASDNMIVIHNSLNEVTISKTDIVTTKELPGASLSICLASLKGEGSDKVYEASSDESSDSDTNESTTSTDENSPSDNSENDSSVRSSTNASDYEMVVGVDGNCIPVTLRDGSGEATWISGDKPHSVSGLPAGAYYLVEVTAPNGYATAESILFKMTEAGVLTDVTGKSLAGNKIVMKDAHLQQVKTGRFVIIMALISVFGVAVWVTYYLFGHNSGDLLAFAGIGRGAHATKVRKRRINR